MVESLISAFKKPVWSILKFKFSSSPVISPLISEPESSIKPERLEKLLLNNSKFLISKASLFGWMDVDPEFLKSKIKDCDAASIRTAKLTGDVIEAANNLKIISRHGVGYDNIDLETSKKNNLTLAITATANAVAVAEHVMFMLLHSCLLFFKYILYHCYVLLFMFLKT